MPRNNFEIYTTDPVTGLITSPGLFEGQPRYLPRFFAHALEGDGECQVHNNKGATLCEFVGILPQDRVDFPELNAHPRPEWVFLKYDEGNKDGGISGSAMTEAEKGQKYVEMQSMYESENEPVVLQGQWTSPVTSGKDLLARIKAWRGVDNTPAEDLALASDLLDDIENWVNRTLIGE